MDIQGKKAIVFGGTSGIGEAAVQMLLDGGAQVVVVSRSAGEATDLPQGATGKSCDVRDRDAMQALFKECAPFDILISAATGGSRAVGPFLQMDMDGFAGSFDKLWGYANVVRFGTQHMSENGSIVLVSGAPARKMRTGQIALSAVGSSVEALVRGVAPEIAPRRINVVSPGVIDTPMWTQTGDERKAFYAAATGNNAIARAGTPQEVAKGILFMVENDFVTGTTIDVDGGWLVS